MPDPSRITDHDHYLALLEIRELKARLAAAENVVEAARVYSYPDDTPFAFEELREAIAAYDAQKAPTGNHAESSTTRGDTHE